MTVEIISRSIKYQSEYGTRPGLNSQPLDLQSYLVTTVLHCLVYMSCERSKQCGMLNSETPLTLVKSA